MTTDPKDLKTIRPRSKLVAVLLVMIALLIGALIYLVNTKDRFTEQRKNTQEALSDQTRQKDALETALENKVMELKSLQVEYQAIGEEKSQIQALINSTKAQLDEWRNKSKDDNKARMLLSVKLKRSMSENQEMLRSFNEELEGFRLREASLEQQNQTLATINDSLNTTTNYQLRTNQTLSSELKKIASKNMVLYTISAQGKVSRDSPFRQKRTQKLVLQVELEPNPYAQMEEKIYYLRITDPRGEVLNDPKKKGASFDLVNGKPFFYSATLIHKFMNRLHQIELSYTAIDPLEKGQYQLECYVDGYSLGLANFEIR